MTYRTKFTDGALTVGETQSTVGMITGVTDPDNVEAFAVIAFNHIDKDHHELVIVSDRGRDRRQIDAILYMAHRATVAQILEDRQSRDNTASWLRDTYRRFERYYNLWKLSGLG